MDGAGSEILHWGVGADCLSFAFPIANMMKQGEFVRKAKSSSVMEIPSDSQQSYVARIPVYKITVASLLR